MLETALLLSSAGFAGVSFARFTLQWRIYRANQKHDLDEVVRLLSKLKKLPTTPLGSAFSTLTLMNIAIELEDRELLEDTWEKAQSRSRFFVRLPELLTASYCCGLRLHNEYQKAQSLLLPALASLRQKLRDKTSQLCYERVATNLFLNHLALGQLSDAEQLLGEISVLLPESHPTTQTSWKLGKAHLYFLSGERNLSFEALQQVSISDFPKDHYTHCLFSYGLSRGLSRCGMGQMAKTALPLHLPKRFTPLLKSKRLLAAASLSAISDRPETALSHFDDILALRIRDGEAYIKASQLSREIAEKERSLKFLHAALELDPESHWAKIAQKKIQKAKDNTLET